MVPRRQGYSLKIAQIPRLRPDIAVLCSIRAHPLSFPRRSPGGITVMSGNEGTSTYFRTFQPRTPAQPAWPDEDL